MAKLSKYLCVLTFCPLIFIACDLDDGSSAPSLDFLDQTGADTEVDQVVSAPETPGAQEQGEVTSSQAPALVCPEDTEKVIVTRSWPFTWDLDDDQYNFVVRVIGYNDNVFATVEGQAWPQKQFNQYCLRSSEPFAG
jgi:hypothetical protein